MYNVTLSAFLAFIATFFSIPVIIQVAKEKRLFDEPDERKVHKTVIPTLGGLGIFAGFILATLLGSKHDLNNELPYFSAAAVVIFFLGIKDDILIISASKKFIGQLLAAGIIIKFGGLQINNMFGLFGIHAIPPFVSVILTFFTIVVITNSFNLIDGVDGLAGTLGLLTTLVFGSYFLYVGEINYAVMAFALSGSLLGFLIYNFSPAKIFMGDTGSLLLGLVNSILVIKFINLSHTSTVSFHLDSAPVIGFAILMIPLFDTLRIFTYRILDRRSPFSPDRNHIHHILLDLGRSHRSVTLICLFANMFFIALAYLTSNLGSNVCMSIIMLAASIFTGVTYILRNKRNTSRQLEETNQKTSIIKSHKIITISGSTAKVK
jgi:UDP-GlcNAc:undecaprenyl-phosphate GlcNAc-1-phosphate transferase